MRDFNLTARTLRIRTVQLEGTCKAHLVHLPDFSRVNQKLKHVIKDIVQMPLEYWQAQGIKHLTRKPVPVFDGLHRWSKSLLQINKTVPLALFQLLPLACTPWRWSRSSLPDPVGSRNTEQYARAGGSSAAEFHTPGHSPPTDVEGEKVLASRNIPSS